MDDRPALSDHDIRTRIDERSYARGFSYHQSGAVSHRQREGATIRARVQGSQPAPYRVWARIGPEGIVDADCSCPVGDGGYCKHVAAMLLDWLEDPDAFRAVEALDTRLAGRSTSPAWNGSCAGLMRRRLRTSTAIRFCSRKSRARRVRSTACWSTGATRCIRAVSRPVCLSRRVRSPGAFPSTAS